MPITHVQDTIQICEAVGYSPGAVGLTLFESIHHDGFSGGCSALIHSTTMSNL